MIHFRCGGCGRHFNVPDNFAGKKATCNRCGATVSVPDGTSPLADRGMVAVKSSEGGTRVKSAVAPEKLPVRTRRLMADAQQMRKLFAQDQVICLKSATGDPVEIYEIEYRLRGIECLKRDEPVFRDAHRVQIQLTSDYPRASPICRMLTPIFHPNIDPAFICVGDHWTAGERLTDLAVRIGEMIAYQAYNIKSPLNAEAAMWADLHPQALPTDQRDLARL